MEEITFDVSRDEESGMLTASWDAPAASGGITTQGKDLRDLQAQILDAVATHFEPGEAPRRIRLHFVSDPILVSVRNFPATSPDPKSLGVSSDAALPLSAKVDLTYGW